MKIDQGLFRAFFSSVIDEHPLEPKITHQLKTCLRLLMIVIQNARRCVRPSKLVCEKITRKKKPSLTLKKTAMPHGVPGKMNHFEAAPDIDHLAAFEPVINLRNPVSKNRSPDPFHRLHDLCPTVIPITTFDVLAIQQRRVNPAARKFLKTRDIEGMIKMPVRQENTLNVLEPQPALIQHLPNRRHATDEPAIDQVNTVIIDEQMMVNDDSADLDEITHALFLNRISVSIDPMSSAMISTLFLGRSAPLSGSRKTQIREQRKQRRIIISKSVSAGNVRRPDFCAIIPPLI